MRLQLPSGPLTGEVELPISKSIANRYLIITALASQHVTLNSFQDLNSTMLKQLRHDEIDSLPEDVRILRQAFASDGSEINIGMAGTAMRFLTAFYAVQEGRTLVLTGAERMKQRPIAELVNALTRLGSEIEYLENEGFPPLRITGKKLKGGEVEIPASISSQFISALMMIGPNMENGLKIRLNGKVLSKPYIDLTADCMRKCGVAVEFDGNSVMIPQSTYQVADLNIESDWTSASYFYALAAARPNSKLLLKGLKVNSSQGDSVLVNWFEKMGVSSVQKENGVEISSSGDFTFPAELDFTAHPDLAQTFAFLAAAIGQPLTLIGLDNLRLKETDRVEAMRTELEKLGASVEVEANMMTVSGSISVKEATIRTYNDHRMAMSAVVLCTAIPVEIEDPEVVAKSFPAFWSAVSF